MMSTPDFNDIHNRAIIVATDRGGMGGDWYLEQAYAMADNVLELLEWIEILDDIIKDLQNELDAHPTKIL